MLAPGYDLRPVGLLEIIPLIRAHHAYGSIGSNATYAFAVFEAGLPVAGYVWQPPPPGAARSVAPEAPYAVLALSRMVAVPRTERLLNHVSKPLRAQMRQHIDRTRWPVLITYSDEGEGHTGHVYRCSGWQPTRREKRPIFLDENGRRASSYSNGAHGRRALTRAGSTTIQRWEHWICERGQARAWLDAHGWRRVPAEGRVWRSGNPAFRYERAASA